MAEKFKFKKYGKPTKSNVKWTYNLDPLKKWITILLGAISLAGSVWMIRQDVLEKQATEAAKIEAKQERKRYLERRLETIKQETIAAELANSGSSSFRVEFPGISESIYVSRRYR